MNMTATSPMEQFDAYIDAHRDRFLEEYFALLRIPSVAAQGTGIAEASTMVKAWLERLGAETRMITAEGGAPVVYATLGSGSPRLLIYDHYDVQPPEPFDQWESPPFEPAIRDGKVYARGAADNKGNLALRLQAIEAWLATAGELPLSITFVIEGEEEIGSRTLPAFCRENAALLQADGCLWETGQMGTNDRPLITCGAKGLLYVELVARGARSDLHSSYAPIVPNPAWRLTWALATLKTPDERVLIPGFYDQVRPPAEAALKALESIPTDEAYLERFGLSAFLGNVQGIEVSRRLLFEPTCTICGLVGGYGGPGTKTVLPAEARAKIDFRLVPEMEPDTLLQQLRAHLDAQGYSDIEIMAHAGEHPVHSDLNSAMVRAVIAAGEAACGLPAIVLPTMAGTGPMHPLCQAFGTPVASGAGCGYMGDQIHAPNENIRLQDYWNGMKWMGHLVQALGTS